MSQVSYQLAEDVLFQKVAEETVILEPETGEYYTLNAIATFMVEQLQQGYAKSKVIDLVLEKYQVSKAEVSQDIEELLAQMLKQGLLVSVDSKVDSNHG
ncbi:PqqD family protein [Colwellia sp. TT2012]|uniref:PqqD family protein n=1 Tax=Colwellia sp. TT2012 TaxID=1720342 RepID=UPI00070FA662|nr:PqqD family protein [Colwellia sp. TT2012]